MPVISSEIKFFKSSTGIGLGGPISATEIVNAAMNNVFDNVNSAEAVAGDVEYRCVYVKNTNPSLTLLSTVIFIGADTASADTNIEIGLDPAGINSSGVAIGGEGIAPTGVVFDIAEDYANGLVIGDLPANGGYQAVWIKRTVLAGAAATASDYATLSIQGETTA